MKRALVPVLSLLAGMGILLTGSGLMGLLLGLRALHEGFSETLIGAFMSMFFLGYVAGAWICPPLIRGAGHARAFAAFAAASAAVSLLYGLVVDPWAWVALRLANGVSLVGMYMVIESWLNERSHESRSQVFAVYMMVSLLALAGGQYLILLYGSEGLESFALVAILFCAGLIPIALTPVAQPAPIVTPPLRLVHLYRTAPVGVAGALASGLVIGCFWALSAVYARARGLDDTGVANFIAIAIAGGASLQWPIGRASDTRDRRLVMAVVCVAAAVSALAMLLIDGDAPVLTALVAFAFGGFAFSLYGLSVARTQDRFGRGEALEAIKGLLLVYGLGATLGPLALGAAMQRAPQAFPLVLAAVLVLLALFSRHAARDTPEGAPFVDEDHRFMPVHRTTPVAVDLDPRLARSEGQQ